MREHLSRAFRHTEAFGIRSLMFAVFARLIRPARHGAKRLRFNLRTMRFRVAAREPTGGHAGYIISLTTFPDRARHVWATVETLLRQSVRAQKVILVLAEEEFPDRRIPRSLERCVQRGLEILWITMTMRSYAKFLPARAAFPTCPILTVDDDILYEVDFAARLLSLAREHPGSIVGHRGWIPQRASQSDHLGSRRTFFAPYRSWMRHPAGPQTPSPDVFLTGVGGVLYPRLSAFDAVVGESEIALRLAPTADDVWFWGVAQSTGTPTRCTGQSFGQPNGLEELSGSLNASNVFGRRNDVAIAAVAHHFNLRPRDSSGPASGA